MTNACWPGEKRQSAPGNPYTVVVRRAAIFSAVAVPVVGFNMFAASQASATIHSWSLAITIIATLLGSVFVVWAGSVLWPTRRALERQQDRPLEQCFDTGPRTAPTSLRPGSRRSGMIKKRAAAKGHPSSSEIF